MRILLTNDDGVRAPGLHAAWKALNADGHEVFACVPDRPRSACSHQITMHKPLRVQKVDSEDGVAWAVNGTPGDCVPLALLQLMKEPPDLCISGINLGPNLGDDVHYSGTVAGAMEATFHGLKAFSISLADWQEPKWEAAAKFCAQWARAMENMTLPRDTFCNVNVPNVAPHEVRGVRATTQGSRRYKGDITRHEVPGVGAYYWRGGILVDRSERDDTDILAISDGFISVTPLHVDLTRMDALDTVRAAL
jgi:5'-nucleotidase